MNRSDKLLIAAAVALALAVLGGLVLFKKPGIFSGGQKPAPAVQQAAPAAPPAPVAPDPGPARTFAPQAAPEPGPQPDRAPPGLPQVGGKLSQTPPAGAITQELPTPPGMVPEKPPTPAKPLSPSDVPSGPPQMPAETLPGGSRTPGAVGAPSAPSNPSPGPAPGQTGQTGQTPKDAAAFPPSVGDKKLDQMFAELAEPTMRKEAPPPGKAPVMPEETAGQAAPGQTPPAPEEKPEAKAPAAPEPKPSAVEGKVTGKEQAKDKAKGKGKGKEEKPAPETAGAAKPAGPDTAPQAGAEAKPEAKPEATKPEAKPEAKPQVRKEAAAPKAKAAPSSAPNGKGGPATLPRGKVSRIQAVNGPADFVITLGVSAAPSDVKSFFIDNPPRFIFDIVGAYTFDTSGIMAGSGIVKGIRLAEHPGYFRVVVDLAPDYASKLRGRPVIEKNGSAVVLRIPHE